MDSQQQSLVKIRRKMLSIQINGYKPAVYKDNQKDKYVVYTFKDPHTGENIRKRIRLNYIKNNTERKKYAKLLCANINKELASGIFPGYVKLCRNETATIIQALKDYISEKRRLYDQSAYRKDSLRTMRSMTNQLATYLKNTGKVDLLMIHYDIELAKDFIRFCRNTKKLSNNTLNNYIGFYRVISNWFIEELYIESNPFKAIKLYPKVQKKRVILTHQERQQVKRWALEHKRGFLIPIYLAFHSAIRRTEMCKIKVADVDLKRKVIAIDGFNISKNRKTRYATLPQEVVQELIHYGIENANPNQYLVGRGFQIADVACKPDKITRQWSRMRNRLDFPNTKQFYSLRDTGGVQKSNDGISIYSLKQHFDHYDLQTTSTYFTHTADVANKDVLNKSSDF